MIYHGFWISHFPHSPRLQRIQKLSIESAIAAKTQYTHLITLGPDDFQYDNLPKIPIDPQQTSLQWGDKFPLPIIHTILNPLSDLANNSDWLLLANTDLVYSQQFYQFIDTLDKSKVYGFRRLNVDSTLQSLEQIFNAPTYQFPFGVDLIAITKQQYLNDYDILWKHTLVLGEPEWDPAVAGYYKHKKIWQNIDYSVYHPIHPYRWDLDNLSKSATYNYNVRQQLLNQNLADKDYTTQPLQINSPFPFQINSLNDLTNLQNFLHYSLGITRVDLVNNSPLTLPNTNKINIVQQLNPTIPTLPNKNAWYPHSAYEIYYTNKIKLYNHPQSLKLHLLPQFNIDCNGHSFTNQIKTLTLKSSQQLTHDNTSITLVPNTSLTLPLQQYFHPIHILTTHDKLIEINYNTQKPTVITLTLQHLVFNLTLDPNSTTHILKLHLLMNKPLFDVSAITLQTNHAITLSGLTLRTIPS